jgi:hypothetical protein
MKPVLITISNEDGVVRYDAGIAVRNTVKVLGLAKTLEYMEWLLEKSTIEELNRYIAE